MDLAAGETTLVEEPLGEEVDVRGNAENHMVRFFPLAFFALSSLFNLPPIVVQNR